jgi:hypothetical protein
VDHDTGIQGIYDVGHLSVRQGGSKTFTLRCSSLGYYVHQYTLTRLTFAAPDGTEYELIDQGTNGEPNGSDCSTGGFNRGKTFVTADGTSATFISNTDIHDYLADNPGNYVPEGYLMLRDGSRYHIVANSGDVDWMTDRNGNKFTFGHDIYGRLTSRKDTVTSRAIH